MLPVGVHNRGRVTRDEDARISRLLSSARSSDLPALPSPARGLTSHEEVDREEKAGRDRSRRGDRPAREPDLFRPFWQGADEASPERDLFPARRTYERTGDTSAKRAGAPATMLPAYWSGATTAAQARQVAKKAA